MKKVPIVLAGEVLFDCFPDTQVLGGAPFNVAWHLQALGATPVLISRIGHDARGRAIIEAMRDWQMDASGLELDSDHPTGQVSITLDQGEPNYSIEPDQAYDFISGAHFDSLPDEAFFYHGSLALRNPVSRTAIRRLSRRYSGRVFMDVNLRAPWWQKQDVLTFLDGADWVKLNRDELFALHEPCADLEHSLDRLIERHALAGAVVTLGREGAIGKRCHDRHLYQVSPPDNLDVIDAVGAGDAFTAVLLLGLSRNWPFEETLHRAQAFASLLVTRRGATVREANFYRPFLDQWTA
ncbi:MAG: carbohydrate kinase [Methylococcales bacterium]|nr:carbohydrate kinase [Methylococcales bacterium]